MIYYGKPCHARFIRIKIDFQGLMEHVFKNLNPLLMQQTLLCPFYFPLNFPEICTQKERRSEQVFEKQDCGR